MYHRIRACWDLGIHSRNVELLCTPKRIFSSTLPVPGPVKTKSSVYVFSGSNKDTVSDVCLIIRLFFVTIMQYQAKDITVIKTCLLHDMKTPTMDTQAHKFQLCQPTWKYLGHIVIFLWKTSVLRWFCLFMWSQTDSVILTSELRGSHTICCICFFVFLDTVYTFLIFLRNALQKQTVAEPLKT